MGRGSQVKQKMIKLRDCGMLSVEGAFIVVDVVVVGSFAVMAGGIALPFPSRWGGSI